MRTSENEYRIRNKDISLILNEDKITVLNRTDISKYKFISWLSQAWFFVNDEGLIDSLFDKKLLIDFFQESIHSPYAIRRYYVYDKNNFICDPIKAKIHVLESKNHAPSYEDYNCEICINISNVGNLYFMGSYILFHDTEGERLHIVYFD